MGNSDTSENYIQVEAASHLISAWALGMEDDEKIYDLLCDVRNDLSKLHTYTPAELMAGMWVPVTERVPGDGERVLAYSPDFGCAVDEYSEYGFMCVNITHWMPLPQPPKEDTA